MGYKMKGFSGFKSSPTKVGVQSPKEALDKSTQFNPDDSKNKLSGDKASTQNKHTQTGGGDGSQYEVRENKTRSPGKFIDLTKGLRDKVAMAATGGALGDKEKGTDRDSLMGKK